MKSIKNIYSWLILLMLIVSNTKAETNKNADEQMLEKKISLQVVDKTMKYTLEQIEQTAQISFCYNSEILPENKKITIFVEDEPVSSVLDELLTNKALAYKLVAEQVVIYSSKNENTVTTISGSIKDGTTGEIIPFAHIAVEGSEIGTVSDGDGRFVVEIPQNYKRDKIVVSYIGYRKQTVFLPQTDSVNMQIALQQAIYDIKTVTAKPKDPRAIIRAATAKIPYNYGVKPVMMTAFFKETVKKDSNNVSVSEAILDIYKTPYNKKERDRIALVKGKYEKDVMPTKSVGVKVQGGPYNMVNLDIAKSRISFIHKSFFKFYDYELKEIITVDGRQLYVIEFDQKANVKASLFRGDIYIDTQTLAYVFLDFELSEKGIKYAKDVLISETPKNTTTIPLKAKYKVEYIMTENGKWQLSSINGFNRIVVVSTKHGESNTFTTESELIITGCDTTNVDKIPEKFAYKPGQILGNEVKRFGDKFANEELLIKTTNLDQEKTNNENKLKNE